MDLPELTDKESQCVINYLLNGKKKADAYRNSYDCSNMNDNSVYVESSRFFSSPKISLWLEYYNKNVTESLQNKLNYNALQHFEELNEMKTAAMKAKDRNMNPNVAVALKAVELKGKLAGLYSDNDNSESSNFTVMGDIKIDGKSLNYKVGDDIDSTAEDS